MVQVTKFKSGLERDFHRTFKLPYETIKLSYVVTHTYTPDFTVSQTAFIETKGRFTGADRAKHLHIKKQHPNIEILLVFQDPHRKLSKTSKTTYAQWCEKHGIRWAHVKGTQAIKRWINSHQPT